METSQIERAAVAAVAAPTVPLAVLVEALAALSVAAELALLPAVSVAQYTLIVLARDELRTSMRSILKQQVGVTA